jgi:hypothetical protein
LAAAPGLFLAGEGFLLRCISGVADTRHFARFYAAQAIKLAIFIGLPYSAGRLSEGLHPAPIFLPTASDGAGAPWW